MTVAQLIEHLRKLPADLPVYLADWNEGYAPDCSLDDAPTLEPAWTSRKRPDALSLPERVLLGGRL